MNFEQLYELFKFYWGEDPHYRGSKIYDLEASFTPIICSSEGELSNLLQVCRLLKGIKAIEREPPEVWIWRGD